MINPLRSEAEAIYKTDRQEVWREKTGAPRTATDGDHWGYGDPRTELGGNLRWGITPNYTANATIVTEIKNALRNNLTQSWLQLGEYDAQTDPYRAFMWDGHYTWGSNQLKSEFGRLNQNLASLNTVYGNMLSAMAGR